MEITQQNVKCYEGEITRPGNLGDVNQCETEWSKQNSLDESYAEEYSSEEENGKYDRSNLQKKKVNFRSKNSLVEYLVDPEIKIKKRLKTIEMNNDNVNTCINSGNKNNKVRENLTHVEDPNSGMFDILFVKNDYIDDQFLANDSRDKLQCNMDDQFLSNNSTDKLHNNTDDQILPSDFTDKLNNNTDDQILAKDSTDKLHNIDTSVLSQETPIDKEIKEKMNKFSDTGISLQINTEKSFNNDNKRKSISFEITYDKEETYTSNALCDLLPDEPVDKNSSEIQLTEALNYSNNNINILKSSRHERFVFDQSAQYSKESVDQNIVESENYNENEVDNQLDLIVSTSELSNSVLNEHSHYFKNISIRYDAWGFYYWFDKTLAANLINYLLPTAFSVNCDAINMTQLEQPINVYKHPVPSITDINLEGKSIDTIKIENENITSSGSESSTEYSSIKLENSCTDISSKITNKGMSPDNNIKKNVAMNNQPVSVKFQNVSNKLISSDSEGSSYLCSNDDDDDDQNSSISGISDLSSLSTIESSEFLTANLDYCTTTSNDFTTCDTNDYICEDKHFNDTLECKVEETINNYLNESKYVNKVNKRSVRTKCSTQYFRRDIYGLDTCGLYFNMSKCNTDKKKKEINPNVKVVVYGTDSCSLHFPINDLCNIEQCNYDQINSNNGHLEETTYNKSLFYNSSQTPNSNINNLFTDTTIGLPLVEENLFNNFSYTKMTDYSNDNDQSSCTSLLSDKLTDSTQSLESSKDNNDSIFKHINNEVEENNLLISCSTYG